MCDSGAVSSLVAVLVIVLAGSTIVSCRAKGAPFPCGDRACDAGQVCSVVHRGVAPMPTPVPPGQQPGQPTNASSTRGCHDPPWTCFGKTTCACAATPGVICREERGGVFTTVALP